jgi:hypothetical protein
MQYVVMLFFVMSLYGCSAIDSIVVPLDRASRDINETEQNFDLPLLSDTHMYIKGSGLAIEKKF